MANYKERTNAALGVALRRQYETPLDVSTVFLCIEDLEAYVHRNKTYSNPKYTAEDNDFLQKINPYSYPGQIVAVINEEAKTATAYIISSCGIDGTYQEIGSGGISEDNIGLIQKVSVDPAITEKSHYAVYNNSEQKLKIILNGKYESLAQENDLANELLAENKPDNSGIIFKLVTKGNVELSSHSITVDDTFNLSADETGNVALANKKYKIVLNGTKLNELLETLTDSDAGTLIYQIDTNELWLFVSKANKILLTSKITPEEFINLLKANVDSELSTTSENPVQNKIITAEINALNSRYLIVNTLQERDALTDLKLGTKCFVVGVNALYIWNNNWYQMLLRDELINCFDATQFSLEADGHIKIKLSDEDFVIGSDGKIIINCDDTIVESGKHTVRSGTVYTYVNDRIDNTLGIVNTELEKI